MKENKDNIAILKKMGFKKDGDGWYSHKSGWVFNVCAFKNIPKLVDRLLKVENEIMNGKTSLSIEDLPEVKKAVKKHFI